MTPRVLNLQRWLNAHGATLHSNLMKGRRNE